MIKAGLIATVAFFAASPVLAADLFVPEEPMIDVSSTYDFGGFYLGVQLGGQTVSVTNTGGPGFVTPGGSGWLAGAHAGYNHQVDNFVIGLEGDIEYSSFAASAPCGNPAFTCSSAINAQGSLRARAGYAADQVLFYLTAGLAAANFSGATNNGVNFPDSSVRLGWTAGGGVEVGLAENVTGRVEYRYTNLGSRDMTYDLVYPGVAVTSHAIRFGVSIGL